MKNKLVTLIGIVTTLWSIHIRAEELCTEDFLYNASFDDVDNLGVPLDWRTRGDYDNRGVVVEDGVLKLWVNEGGNHDGGGVLFLGQKFVDPLAVVFSLAGDTMYLRAWVKSTAIDEPTDEELIAAYLKDDPDKDTTGTHFRHNFGSHGGFNLVVQEATSNPGPPWFVPVEWTPWYDHDGKALESWEAVNGKMVLKTNVNYIDFWIQLRSKSACTVWVDNIQISSSPEFCGEEFNSPDGTVRMKNCVSQYMKSDIRKKHNNTITFQSQTKYKMDVFKPNGKLCVSRTGRDTKINLHTLGLPAGAYIFDLKSERGDIIQSFIMQK